MGIDHIAEEIKDVGKSEQRELESRMAVLIAHLLKWRYQPDRRSSSWLRTLNNQRTSIQRRLTKTPSLKRSLNELEWWSDLWVDACVLLEKEAGRVDVPAECPWSTDQVLAIDSLPDD